MSVPNRMPRSPQPQAPERPRNALHDIGEGVGRVVGAPMVAVDALNTGFAQATSAIAQVFPSMPAATLGSLTVGGPHAHTLHPPSGPLPIPPTPIPPVGVITAGVSVQVLINGQPAARCGDIIVNPTCCGLPPFGEVKTGSSNVFIGGARAARLLDITMHCTPVPAGATARAAAGAARTGMGAAAKAMMAVQVAGMAAQGLQAAGDAVEAVEADNASMSAALGQSSAMMTAQLAADAVAMAMAMAMGKDLCVPPGTPGAVVVPGSANVLIGGFPMPSWMDIARGLMRAVRRLRARRQARGGRGRVGFGTCRIG